MSILLKDASVSDLLPDFLKEQVWIKAYSEAVKKVFTQLLDLSQKTITYSNVDNLPDELLDILAIELQTPNYMQSYGTNTKRALIKNTLAYHYAAGSVHSTKEMIQAIFGGTSTIKEWFQEGYNTDSTELGEPGHFKVDILGEGGEIILSKNIETFRVLIEQIKRKSSVLDSITVHIEPFTVNERMAAVMIESETKTFKSPTGAPINPNFVPGEEEGNAVFYLLSDNDFEGVEAANNNNEDLYEITVTDEVISINAGTEAADLLLERKADETLQFSTCEAVARINGNGELIIAEGNKYTYAIEDNCLIAIPKEEWMNKLPTLNLGRIKPIHRGIWSINAEYKELDIVTYNGHTYWVLQTVKGVTPSDDGINYNLMI